MTAVSLAHRNETRCPEFQKEEDIQALSDRLKYLKNNRPEGFLVDAERGPHCQPDGSAQSGDRSVNCKTITSRVATTTTTTTDTLFFLDTSISSSSSSGSKKDHRIVLLLLCYSYVY
jgi:hypothetical protein